MTTLTAAQAATALGLSLTRVHQLCRAGRLPGAVNTIPAPSRRGEWRIPETALVAYRETERNQPNRCGLPSKVARSAEITPSKIVVEATEYAPTRGWHLPEETLP